MSCDISVCFAILICTDSSLFMPSCLLHVIFHSLTIAVISGDFFFHLTPLIPLRFTQILEASSSNTNVNSLAVCPLVNAETLAAHLFRHQHSPTKLLSDFSLSIFDTGLRGQSETHRHHQLACCLSSRPDVSCW